jgi:hypothetical protein
MQSTFMVNIARFPWMEDTVPVWRPLPGAACMRLEAVVHAMTEPGYDGPLTMMVPLPLVVRTPVEIPRSYFAVVRRQGARAIQLNQFRVEIRPNGGRLHTKRPVLTPVHVLTRYPHIAFNLQPLPDQSLSKKLFWDVLTDHVEALETIFPAWRFPYMRLTAHELFTHMQLPVRRHYTRQIRKYFAPHLRMLKRALLPSAADRGCALGRLSPELMARITALVVEEWGYE